MIRAVGRVSHIDRIGAGPITYMSEGEATAVGSALTDSMKVHVKFQEIIANSLLTRDEAVNIR